MRTKISASVLSIILVAALVLLIAGATAGFIYVRGILLQKANDTAAVTTESANSNTQITVLKQEQAALNENAAVEQKVQSMVATGIKYTYQDQVVDALKAIAGSANVTITNIDFTSSLTGTSTGTSTPTTGSIGSGAAAPLAIPGNVTLKQVNVTLASPLSYDNLMHFLRDVEQNTMSMKVARVSITGTGKTQGGSTLVNCDALTIGVYMR